MVGENGPQLDGWAVSPRPHCGDWHESIECPTCLETIAPTEPDVWLGEN